MYHIIIIEDDDEVRFYLERILTRAGYTVTAVCNGREGVEMFRENPADLVITDIIMPEMDGIEAIIDLRRQNRNLKVIAISGGGRAEPQSYLNSARLLGADRTMKKPFSNEEILGALKDLLPEGS